MPQNFPKWVYGPNNQSKVVNSASDVPSGWVDHPSQLEGAAPLPDATPAPNASLTPTPEEAAAANAKALSQSGLSEQQQAAAVQQQTPQTSSVPKAPPTEVDASGVAWDAAINTADKGKTSSGLWQLLPGKSRPAKPLDL